MSQRSQQATAAVRRARAFLTDELWDADFEPRTWPARGLAALQFGAMLAEGFVRDQLLLRASALTYYAVLSLIPLVAIAISVASAVGVTANLAEVVVAQLAAGSPEAQGRILGLIENADFAGLGGLGAAILFVTSVLGISSIERSLNHIWGVKQQRSLGRRFTDYLAVLVIAPLLLGGALSLGTTLKSQWLVQRLIELPAFALLYDLGLRQMPMVVMALAFAFLYWFLPNTLVRPSAALLGGAVAAVLVTAAQSVYLGASIGVARANAFFGSVAFVPLLFVWIYFFWAIVLFGAEVAFAYQNLRIYRREVRGRIPESAEREAIAMRIALEVARAFRDAAPPWSDEELSEALRVSVRAVRDVLARLRSAGIVRSVGAADKEDGVQLGRPAERIAVADVLAALRGERDAPRGEQPLAHSVDQLLAEIDEAEAKGAGAQTLAELLAGIPPREAAS
jgi:membrane protein